MTNDPTIYLIEIQKLCMDVFFRESSFEWPRHVRSNILLIRYNPRIIIWNIDEFSTFRQLWMNYYYDSEMKNHVKYQKGLKFVYVLLTKVM